MLHVATVHYKSPRWIDIQTKYLREHIQIPGRIWGSLELIDPSYSRYFDRVIEQLGSHAEKLNHLALEISQEASADDLLMFLDGDAFPVVDPMPLISDALATAPLVAVRRAENLNEPQPHPCFCVTTVGTWARIHGDWSRGPTWPEVHDLPASDVGALLLRALEVTGTPWVQLLRSNGTTLHPLFFAVYGDIVYHHGGGFRASTVVTRQDRALAPRPKMRFGMNRAHRVAHLLNRRRLQDWLQTTEDRNRHLSELVFEKISQGGRGWLGELDWPNAPAVTSHDPS